MSRIGRLLAATDFSAGARYAVRRAAQLASENGSKLELLHVVALRRIAAPTATALRAPRSGRRP